MKRITLNLDLEDNEVLSKEIESMVKATVEHKYKGFIDSVADEFVKERVEKRIKEWENHGWGQKSRIDKAIDEAIEKGVKIPELNKDEILKYLDGKVKNREELFEYVVRRSLNIDSLKKYIDNSVESELKKVLASKFLEMIFNEKK